MKKKIGKNPSVNPHALVGEIILGDWIAMANAIGEIAIAAVIYWEWEANRLDQFLEDAGNKNSRSHLINALRG